MSAPVVPAKRSIPIPPSKPKLGTPAPVPFAKPSKETQDQSKSTASPSHQDVAASGPVLANDSVFGANNTRTISSPAIPQKSLVVPPKPSSTAHTIGSSPSNSPKTPPKPASRPRSAQYTPGQIQVSQTAPIPVLNDYPSAPSNDHQATSNLNANQFLMSEVEFVGLQKMFKEMDIDKDGVISVNDFLSYMSSNRKLLNKFMSEASPRTLAPTATRAPINDPTPQSATSSHAESTTSNNNSKDIKKSASNASVSSINIKEDSNGYSTEDEESDSNQEIRDLLDFISSSSDEETDEAPKEEEDAPKKGFSFRNVDTSTLKENANDDSSDDDALLADWDGPANEDDANHGDDKPKKEKHHRKSGSFGGIKKKLSIGAAKMRGIIEKKTT